MVGDVWIRSGGWALLALTATLVACGEPGLPRFVELELPGDTRDPVGPYLATAVIDGAEAAAVIWQLDGGPEEQAPMVRINPAWQGRIPGVAPGTTVRVWLTARNAGGTVRTSPATFTVLDPDGACLVDGQCLPGEICGDGRCRVPPPVCQSDADCGQDLYCATPGEPCRFRPTVCAEDRDCAPGDRCIDGRCGRRPACTDDGDCPDGRCDGGRCVPERPCVEDGECPDGEACADGICAPGGPMVPCPGGCPAGLRCLAPEAACVQCTADGHCPEGHCDLEAFTCALGVRGRPCVPCGPRNPCGAGYLCPADIGAACIPRCGAHCIDQTGCGNGCTVPDDRFCGGPICDVDADCDSRVCLSGWCEPRQYCARDADCADGRQCASGRCIFEAAACRRPGDCAAGELCLGGRCSPGRVVDPCSRCSLDDDCPSPALCVPFEDGVRRCAALCGSTCPGPSLECLVVDAGLLVCLAPDASCPEDRCGDDPLEPDDEPRLGTELSTGAVIEGRLCDRDADWIIIDGAPGSVFFIQTQGILRASILDGEREVLRALDVPAGGEATIGLPAGAFFIQLTTDADGEFAWTAILGPPPPPACDDDGFEPNDDDQRATVLGGGADIRAVACPENEDWFRVRSRNRPGTVRIDGEGELDVRLLDADERLVEATRGRDRLELQIQPGNDIVFAVVRCVACPAGVPYRLRTVVVE